MLPSNIFDTQRQALGTLPTKQARRRCSQAVRCSLVVILSCSKPRLKLKEAELGACQGLVSARGEGNAKPCKEVLHALAAESSGRYRVSGKQSRTSHAPSIRGFRPWGEPHSQQKKTADQSALAFGLLQMLLQ